MEQVPGTVLYVEDNLENRVLVRRILMAEGYTVLEAESAADGFDLAQDQKPNLVLVDINMPLLDGLSLASIMKADPALQAIPVIALTANVMKGDRERTLAAGCDGYIQKPIDVDFFPGQIARFLQQTKPKR
jgi:two-component system cell cycle response regulator DivK